MGEIIKQNKRFYLSYLINYTYDFYHFFYAADVILVYFRCLLITECRYNPFPRYYESFYHIFEHRQGTIDGLLLTL